MGDPAGLSNANEAARTSTELFKNFKDTGLPIIQGATNYTSGRLGQIAAGGGLPSYVKQGYDAARGGVFDSAMEGVNAARGRARGPAEVQAYTPAYAGASADVARERAGIGFSQAANSLNERIGLMKVAAGGAADASNLSIGFGNLGLRGIAGMSAAGSPAYGAVQGGLSAILGAYADGQIQRGRSALSSDYVTGSQYAGQGAARPAGAGPVPFD